MSKRFLFTILVLSALVIFSVAGICLADALEQLEKVETYKWYPAQAEAIYQEIARDYPGSDYALTAHKNLVISYVLAERHNDAQQKLNQMSTAFASNSGLPAALYEIARIYERLRKYTEAKSIYQQITENHYSSAEATKAQLSTPRMAILGRIDDKTDASAVVEQLITDFSSHPELPSSLYDIARRYERAKLYKDAENLYQRIIQQYSGSSSARQARLGVCRSQALSYIESKNFEQAALAINSMLVDFAGHPDLSEALYDVGIRYERAGQYQQAKDAYRQITQGYPDSSHGGRAGLDSSKVDIYLLIDSGQTAAAETATDSLIVSFSGHSCLPEALEQIAKRLEWSQNYIQAQRIYNQAAEHTQATEALLNAEKCRILGLVETGEYGSVRPDVNQLVSDYPGYELLPWAVKQIANQYYEEVSELETEVSSEQFQSHISDVAMIYELIINQLPNSKANAEACYNAGECYYKTGNYPKAIVYYQKLVDEHSYYPLTWDALFRVGHSYEKMAAAGLISKSEAEPKIKAAYSQLLEKYPDCKAAMAARQWLMR